MWTCHLLLTLQGSTLMVVDQCERDYTPPLALVLLI